MEPHATRLAIRRGEIRGSTADRAPGFAQANLVALPADLADGFLTFCERNPKPCPLIEVVPGGRVRPECAAGADLRTDLPGYRVYRTEDGVTTVTERTDVRDIWSEDLVAFLLGCSYTFDQALSEAGIALGHVAAGGEVAMYVTGIETVATDRFGGPLVASMRWIPESRVADAIAITSAFPGSHGSPIHVGDPAAIGIRDLARPDYGQAWPAPAGSLPVFWACGVTPQAVAVASGVPFMITHAPGRMLVTDLRVQPLEDPTGRAL